MGYGQTLVVGWTRRELLVVTVIAITAAFLVGTTLALSATSAETAELVEKYDTHSLVRYHASATNAQTTAEPGDVVLPVAKVTEQDGQATLVVGIPRGAPRTIPHASFPWANAHLPPTPADGTLRGPVRSAEPHQFQTSNGGRTFDVAPHRETSVLSSDWYVSSPTAVRQMGQDGALVVHPRSLTADGTPPSADGVALAAVILYLYRGTAGLITTLALIALGACVLVGVTVYNVTRTSVDDRRQTIFVVRATGGTSRKILALFALRSGLITAAGLFAGLLVGVVAVKGVVELASTVGNHATLNPSVTPTSAFLLSTTVGALEIIGIVSGALAARATAAKPPAQLFTPKAATQGAVVRRRTGRTGAEVYAVANRTRSALTPRLLTWRALLPTAATLTVFAVVAIFVLSITSALAPLAGAGGNTVVDPAAPHPLASEVSVERAEAVRSAGGNASAEILLTGVEDGQPYLIRGANFSAFSAVTEAALVRGRSPKSSSEAVIGDDLARTLDVRVGETMTVGGSTVPRVMRVTVVGVYEGPGLVDDQLLLPLDASRRLTLVSPGYANLVRTDGQTNRASGFGNQSADGPLIVAATIPDRAAANDSVPVAVTLYNPEKKSRTRTVNVSVGTERNRTRVRLGPGERRTVTVRVPTGAPGDRRVRVGSYETTIQIVPQDVARLAGLPPTAPPDARLRLRTQGPNGEPVGGAAVTVGQRSTHAGSNGSVLLRAPTKPGTYPVRVDHEQTTHHQQLTVEPGAKPLAADLRVTPTLTAVRGRATANVTLYNPWSETVTREVAIRSERWARSRSVSLEPGERVTMTVDVPEAAGPGKYTVEVVGASEMVLANDTYTVVEGPRGDLEAKGAGAAVSETVLQVTDNLWVLQVTMGLLAAGLVVGSTTTAFAQAVHARRRVIGVHRATGATPGDILRLILGDAVRIGLVATVLAIVLAELVLHLSLRMGLLTLFGVRIRPAIGPAALAVVCIAGVSISVVSAVLATRRYLSAHPNQLLSVVPDRLDRGRLARLISRRSADNE